MINLGQNHIGDDGCRYISKLKAPFIKKIDLCSIQMTKGKIISETKDASGCPRASGLSFKN